MSNSLSIYRFVNQAAYYVPEIFAHLFLVDFSYANQQKPLYLRAQENHNRGFLTVPNSAQTYVWSSTSPPSTSPARA